MPKIHYIIFDLGGVIVDINSPKMKKNFENIGIPSQLFDTQPFSHLSHRFETGEVKQDDFCFGLREMARKYIDNQSIWNAWNSLVEGIPQARVDALLRLKNQYRTYALSNTNIEHISHINSCCLTEEKLETLFHKTYYSYEVGLRKPDKKFFEHVLRDMGAVPCETLFIDDLEENLKPAHELGIQTMLVKKNQFDFTDLHNRLNAETAHNFRLI